MTHSWIQTRTQKTNRIETSRAFPVQTLTIRINMPVEYLKSSGLLLQLERLCEVQIRQIQVRPLRWKVSSPYTSSSKVTEPVVHEIDCTLWERLRQYCKILASWSDYTNFTEWSRSWEAISSSARQEKSPHYMESKFHTDVKTALLCFLYRARKFKVHPAGNYTKSQSKQIFTKSI